MGGKSVVKKPTNKGSVCDMGAIGCFTFGTTDLRDINTLTTDAIS